MSNSMVKWLCIQDVPASNLGLKTDYGLKSLWLSLVLPRTVPEHYLQNSTYRTVPEHYLQNSTYRTLPTEQYLQNTTYRTLPTEHYLQNSTYRTVPEQYLQNSSRTLPTEQYLQNSTYHILYHYYLIMNLPLGAMWSALPVKVTHSLCLIS
jgi:hypothetical protein